MLQEKRLWARAVLWALAVAAFGCLYFFVRQYIRSGVWHFGLGLVNKSLGVTSLVMITLSMFLTSWSRFFKRGGRSLALRKYVGLTGFWLGLLHGALDHLLLPAIGLRSENESGNIPANAVGWTALVLFAVLTIISNETARRKLGTALWRKALRYGGYAGLTLAVAHSAFLKGDSWSNFFRTFDPALPSLSLPAALFGAITVLLRLALWISGRRKKA